MQMKFMSSTLFLRSSNILIFIKKEEKVMKKFLRNFEEYIGAFLFVIMFVILILQIFSRQILNKPLIWSEQLSMLIFVYVALLGVVLGIKHQQHIGIDIINEFKDKLPALIVKGIDIIKDITVFIIIIIFFIVGLAIAIRKQDIELVSLGMSYFYLYISLPLASVLMMIRFIEGLLKKRAHNTNEKNKI